MGYYKRMAMAMQEQGMSILNESEVSGMLPEDVDAKGEMAINSLIVEMGGLIYELFVTSGWSEDQIKQTIDSLVQEKVKEINQ